MTLEDLQVRFTADISPLSSRIRELHGLLTQAGAQADALTNAFRGAGASAGDGLASGIASRKSAVVSAAREVALAAANALRSALSIHSPSRVTMLSGARFTEGFTKGITGGAGRARLAAEQLSLGAANALNIPDAPINNPQTQQSGDSHALDRISLTIPLHIDGYQLGVAAIDGINRVSRSTGGVELTI